MEQLKAYQKSGNLSQKIKDKLSDLCIIMEGYQQFLQKEYISGDELLDLLAERLQTMEQWKDIKIWIDGFYGFTPQEYKIIKQLLRLAKTVTITLSIDSYTFEQSDVPMYHGFYEPFMTAKKSKKLQRSKTV